MTNANSGLWLSHLRALKLFYQSLLLPLEDSLPPWDGDALEREEAPIWHLGHACFDLCRVLLQPYGDRELSGRYGEIFLGLNAHQPWEAEPPHRGELIQWWEASLERIEEYLPRYQGAPQFVLVLDEWPIETPAQAWEYALFHTGFHLGRIHQMIGW